MQTAHSLGKRSGGRLLRERKANSGVGWSQPPVENKPGPPAALGSAGSGQAFQQFPAQTTWDNPSILFICTR